MTEIQSLVLFVLTCLDLREYLVHTFGMIDTSFSSEVSLDTSYSIVSWCGLEKYPLNSVPKELYMPPPELTEQYACQERIISGASLRTKLVLYHRETLKMQCIFSILI